MKLPVEIFTSALKRESFTEADMALLIALDVRNRAVNVDSKRVQRPPLSEEEKAKLCELQARVQRIRTAVKHNGIVRKKRSGWQTIHEQDRIGRAIHYFEVASKKAERERACSAFAEIQRKAVAHLQDSRKV